MIVGLFQFQMHREIEIEDESIGIE